VQRIRLDQHTLELQGAEQGFEGRALVGFAGVKRGLGNRNAQLSGVQRDLGDKPSGPIGAIRLRGRPAQGLTVTDQLIKILVLISDLGQHPLPEGPEKLLELNPLKQVEEGGVAGCLGQLQAQRRAERLVMAFGKTFQIPDAAAAAQDPNGRHQQQQPLRVTDASALAAFWESLQEGDQISTGRGRARDGSRPDKTGTSMAAPAALYLTFSRPWEMRRADSKFQQASGWGWRRAIASSALMSCITACKPVRIERKPASLSRFIAAVRRVAITPAPLPR